jgi:glycosyltransferase involved in cell wall biosynthesis
MEALSLGKIVIASNIGGLPEIIKNDENGLIFTPGSSADLASKINYLNSLPSEMCEALEKAAKDTGEQFSAEDNLKSVINIYQKLLAK